ncbi:MAG: class I SAM-dependent methyltransferase [Symploca sp. SIO1B1]|nr:class I SAM-dependent methyltransferase [Symploca sp. SIO1B1]
MKICNYCHHQFNGQTWSCPVCSYTPPSVTGHLTFAPELATASEGFEALFFPQLAKLEAKNFWFRSRNRLLIDSIGYYFTQARNFLEIGCGTGFALQGIEKAFPHLTLSGSEIFSEGLKFAAQRLSRASLFQMDARKIPFSEEFDVVGAFDVLEHIEQDRDVLAQMHQAVRTGGGIILTVPQHPWLWSQADDYAHHFRRYRAKDLHTKVEDAGFRVIRITSFVSLILPLMLISRWHKRKPKPNYDPLSEFKISPWVNTALENILTLERILIKLRISFPMGGSLLLVAQKL